VIPRLGGYDVVGPDGAPSLVLVHGTRLTRAVWAPQAARLSGEFRRATHLANLDQPDAFSGAIRAFVRGPVARAEGSRAGPRLY
jgi:pimeloyl-ACP methyl ester carboxylesterase